MAIVFGTTIWKCISSHLSTPTLHWAKRWSSVYVPSSQRGHLTLHKLIPLKSNSWTYSGSLYSTASKIIYWPSKRKMFHSFQIKCFETVIFFFAIWVIWNARNHKIFAGFEHTTDWCFLEVQRHLFFRYYQLVVKWT